MCFVDNCSGTIHARKMCNKHYLQWKVHGKTIAGNDKRQAVLEAEYAKVPLGVDAKQGYALIDLEDVDLVQMFNWNSHHGYVEGKVNGKVQSLHRLLTNAPKDMQVDHKNGDTLDNRRANLRVCTQLQNSRNSGKHKNNTTGYKGVIVSYGKYAAKLGYMGKKLHLGYYATPEEAAKAYDAKALELHGEFAKLNFNMENK